MEDAARPAERFVERLTGPFAPEAYLMAGAPLALCVAAFWHGHLGLGGFLLGLGVFCASFFRDPNRVIPEEPGLVVAPADGRVIEVGEVELTDGGKGLRIGIFLSVFNVHVNRAPIAGRVVGLERAGDAYLAAFNRDAERRNVRLAMKLETPSGVPVWVVQISGLIARRIVCHAREGESLARGDRYGLIRFGSRTDVILPTTSRTRVEAGDRVRGGETVVAELEKP